MILALDTSTPTCRLWLMNDESTQYFEWEAKRQLADGLLGFLRRSLEEQSRGWQDITGVIAYRGPGSFTGLRIGLTVLNTIADTLSVPIVGATGDDWLAEGRTQLSSGESERLVMPLYGRAPNITQPRK